jgi:hypothetical protein
MRVNPRVRRATSPSNASVLVVVVVVVVVCGRSNESCRFGVVV